MRPSLAVALGNMKAPRAPELAVQLLEDDELAGHAIIALGKIGAPKARRSVEPFLTHGKSWIRKEAQRTIKKLDKASK
jgi:HEAT repeat protein